MKLFAKFITKSNFRNANNVELEVVTTNGNLVVCKVDSVGYDKNKQPISNIFVNADFFLKCDKLVSLKQL